jgi:hypothetical protein
LESSEIELTPVSKVKGRKRKLKVGKPATAKRISYESESDHEYSENNFASESELDVVPSNNPFSKGKIFGR